MSLNKKGASFSFVTGVIVLFVIGFIIYGLSVGNGGGSDGCSAYALSVFDSGHDARGDSVTNAVNVGKLLAKSGKLNPFLNYTFAYVLGIHQGVLEDLCFGKTFKETVKKIDGTEEKNKEIIGSSAFIDNLSMRGLIIFIAVWAVFFLVFLDMTNLVMGFGSKLTGFLIGLAVTLIFANFGLYYSLIIWLMGIYSFVAGLSVVLAMFSIIVLGVGAHFGFGWAIRGIANKNQLSKIMSGADKAAGGVKTAKKMGEAAAEGE